MFGSSQGFGYGDASAPTQQDPAKKTRQEEKQTCMPVTVRILQDAIARHADSQEILIHGTEVAVVHLVGVVEALVEQSAMLEFQLNDGSGRMRVRYYVPGSGSVKPDSLGLAAGRYVSVVGNLRTSPAAHVSAMSLKAITGADEVSYHMIEVAHAAVRLRNPTKAPGLPTGVPAAGPVTPAKQPASELGLGFGAMNTKLSPAKVDAPVVSTLPEPTLPAVVQTPPKGDLSSVIMDVLQQMQDTAGEEGVSFSFLVTRLASQASSEKIREVLTKLTDDGECFTTIDDDHFSVV